VAPKAEKVAEHSEAEVEKAKYPPFFWEGLPPEVGPEVVDEPADAPKEAERSEAEPEPAADLGSVIELLDEARKGADDRQKEKGPFALPVPVDGPVDVFDKALEAMNKQHAIIASVTGKAVIASWEPSSLDRAKVVIVYQTKDSFVLRYSNRRIPIQVKSANGDVETEWMPLAHWWLGHRNRRQYRGITFLPGGPEVVDGVLLNLWRGWACEPKQGDWQLIRRHIEEVLAGGNKEAGEYLIRWLAWSIQNPAKQAEVAVVLIGQRARARERW
jgi:hypothetical protein